MLQNHDMRELAQIVFAIMLLATAVSAQSSGPARREDPLQRKIQSAIQLEMIEAALTRRPDSSASDRNLILNQIKEDFSRIQLANDQIYEAVSKQTSLDLKVIGRAASDIRARAKRLKENLALPKVPKPAEADMNQSAEDLRTSLSRLSQLIESFVSNPMLSQRHVVDADLSLKASHDLEEIIILSGKIKLTAGQNRER